MAQLQTTAITGSVSASAEITAVSFTSSRATGVGFFGTASFALTPAGTAGSSGTSGTAGSAGTSGSSGTSGSTGTSGSSGTAGSSGTSGTRGSSGSSGTSGANGSSGTSGATGASGSSGSTGTSGSSGATGASGSSGTSGATGASGSSGSSGATGANGSSGSSGATGSSGSGGSSGTSGTRGSSGSSGTTGANGSSGTSGANGANGSSGSSGTSASVTINNNTDNYLVTATGTTNTLNGESTVTLDGTTFTANTTNFVVNSTNITVGNDTTDIVSIAGNTVRVTGNNVGIGTTAPVYTLHLAAADTQNTYPTTASINITNTNSAAFSRTMGVNFSVGAGASTEVFAGIYGVYTNYTTTVGGAIAFVTNNGSNSFTEKMRIISNGNVGIGTTSPASTLSVRGSTNLGDSQESSLSSTHQTRISGYALRYDASNRYGNYGNIILHASNGWTSSARRFLISNGLSANKFAIIRSVDASTDPAFGDGGVISSGTADFVIDNGGNVGIGTTTIPSRLSISGSSNGSTPVVDIVVGGTDAFSRGVRMINSSMTNGSSLMYAVGQADSARNMGQFYFVYSSAGSTANRISMGLHSVDDVLNIAGTGNVGIGITNPSYKLQVVGGSIVNSTSVGGTGDAGIGLGDGHRLGFDQSGTRSWTIKPTGGNLQFFSGDSLGYHVFSAAGVGIGTTSPVSLLNIFGGAANWNETTPGTSNGTIHLAPTNTTNFGNAITFGAHDTGGGATAQAGIYVRSNGGYGTKMYFATTDAYVSGAKTRMYISEGGNVGIGTTSPESALHVNGLLTLKSSTEGGPHIYRDGSNAGDIRFYSTNGTFASPTAKSNEGLLGQIHYHGYTGTAYKTAAQIWAIVDGSVTSTVVPGRIEFKTSNSSSDPSTRMTIKSDGNVGINTTSPVEKLTVANTGTSDMISAYRTQNTAGSLSGIVFAQQNASSTKINYAGIYSRISSNTAAAESGDISFYTYNSGTNAERGRLTSVGTFYMGSAVDSGAISAYVTGYNGFAAQVSNNAYFTYSGLNSSGTRTLAITGAGTLTVSGDVVAYGTPSDASYKHDVQQLTNALDTVRRLRGVSFKWNKDTDSHTMVNITDDLGFIAQEVREVLPSIVRENEDGKLSLRDRAIIPLLVEAIKEQQHTIQSLQNRIETLEKK